MHTFPQRKFETQDSPRFYGTFVTKSYLSRGMTSPPPPHPPGFANVHTFLSALSLSTISEPVMN